jgi:hypothetical protein
VDAEHRIIGDGAPIDELRGHCNASWRFSSRAPITRCTSAANSPKPNSR